MFRFLAFIAPNVRVVIVRARRLAIALSAAVAGLVLLSVCAAAGGPGSEAAARTAALVSTANQPVAVTLTGLCGRLPVAAVVAWQHTAPGMDYASDANGCRENPSSVTPGVTALVEYTVNGQAIMLIDMQDPVNFESDAEVGLYQVEARIDSAHPLQETVFIQIGSQYIHVELSRLYNGVDQATKQLLLKIATAATAASPAQGAPADQPGSTASAFGPFFPLSPCVEDQTTPSPPTTINPIPKTTLGILGYILPAGMSYFGIGTQVGSEPLRNSLLVGDSGFHCLDSGGYDSSLALDWAELHSATDPNAHVFTYYAEDPSGNQNTALCWALLSAGMPVQEAVYAQRHPDCNPGSARPSSASSIPVTGSNLTIGYAAYPPGQDVLAEGTTYTTFEVQIFHHDAANPEQGAHQAPITEIDCAEPFSKWASCRETLAEWAQEQLSGLYGIGSGWAAEAAAKLRDRMSASSNATPATEPVEASQVARQCTAPLNATLEKTLARFPRVKVNAPNITKVEPATPRLTIGVAFVPFGFHVCEKGLLGATIDPGSFDIQPRLTVRDEDQDKHAIGPFVYEADAHAWQNSQEIPAGQQLQTKFEPSFGVELLPGVYAALDPVRNKGKVGDVSLDLFALTLQAYPQVIDLWRDARGPILQVTAAPQFELTVGVRLKELGANVSEAETSEGRPSAENAAEATERVADQDAQAVIDEADALTGAHYPVETLHALEAQFDVVIEESALADPALAAAEGAAVEGDLVSVEGESVLDSLEAIVPEVAETAANLVVTEEQGDS